MNPDEQNTSGTGSGPPVGTGSSWQREAVAAARSAAAQSAGLPAQPGQAPNLGPVTQVGQTNDPMQPPQIVVSSGYSGATVVGLGSSSGKKMIFILLAVFLLLVVGVAGFLIIRGQFGNSGDPNQDSVAQATDISNLNGAILNAPSNFGGFTKDNEKSTDTFYVYQNTEIGCTINFGSLVPEQLPSTDILSVVNEQVNTQQAEGLTVSTPEPAEGLKLKDALDPARVYSMPTMRFSASGPNSSLVRYYSLSALDSGSRIVVSRTCSTQNSDTVEDANVKAANDAASRLTVSATTNN